jgi:hypothetical protein
LPPGVRWRKGIIKPLLSAAWVLGALTITAGAMTGAETVI